MAGSAFGEVVGLAGGSEVALAANDVLVELWDFWCFYVAYMYFLVYGCNCIICIKASGINHTHYFDLFIRLLGPGSLFDLGLDFVLPLSVLSTSLSSSE